MKSYFTLWNKGFVLKFLFSITICLIFTLFLLEAYEKFIIVFQNINYSPSTYFNLKLIELILPVPLHTFNDLNSRQKVLSYRKDLWKKSGIYAFINLINGKQYIGSAINIYRRFLDHMVGRQSNVNLQRAFNKYGKDNFKFVVYVYAPYVIPYITKLETLYISYFPFGMLYNISPSGGSMFGYKHNIKAIEKMKAQYLNPSNHPMFGKTHTDISKSLMSKPWILNPMFGKKHSDDTKILFFKFKKFPYYSLW